MSTTVVNVRGELINYAVGSSSLGKVLVASTNTGVVCILMGDRSESLVEDLHTRFPDANIVPAAGDYQRLVDRVIDHVEHPATPFDAPLDIRGTPFQRQVRAAGDPGRKDRHLLRHCVRPWRAEGGPGGRWSVRGEQDRGRDPVPPRGAE
jgi:hypothetical protein